MITLGYQPSMVNAIAGLTRVSRTEADALLSHWGHYLGPCDRPFGVEPWVLEVGGNPVSLAVGASIVSTTAAGFPRKRLVEVARLCSAPDARWATRPMLRLWREVAAPKWPHWPLSAAVAYSANARHQGDIYRFDGWKRVTDRAGSTGGGTWTKRVAADDPAAGAKSLWLWTYGVPVDTEEADRG